MAHVRDGLELGREFGLPRPLLDIIAQHHGTTLVEYFYHKAEKSKRLNETIDENFFRYSGPRPQTREAGIILIADAIEAASRTLTNPSPARIRNLVNSIADNKLGDRQLDECNLSMMEVAQIKETFIHVLTSMFHTRVRYPKQDKGEY